MSAVQRRMHECTRASLQQWAGRWTSMYLGKQGMRTCTEHVAYFNAGLAIVLHSVAVGACRPRIGCAAGLQAHIKPVNVGGFVCRVHGLN